MSISRRNYKSIPAKTAFRLSLPKWAGCYITGPKVSKKIASEYNRRTDSFVTKDFNGNDRKWIKLVNETMKKPSMDYESGANFLDYHKECTKWARKWKCIVLDSLSGGIISTAYVYGPYSVIGMDGKINYWRNVGKYSSVQSVYNDLKLIGKHFGTVKLRCTLYDDEFCVDTRKPLVTLWLEDGKVYCTEPVNETPKRTSEYTIEDCVMGRTPESAVTYQDIVKWATVVYGKNTVHR